MSDTMSPKRPAEQEEHSATQATFKRRRTALACSSCRVRKTRCNGERPCCVPCVELGLECYYENPANGNARFQQPTYDDRLRNIEDTLRLLVHSSQSHTHGVAPRPVLERSISSTLDHHPESVRVARLQDDIPAAEVDNGAIDGMASYTDPNDARARFYGPSSNIAFLRTLSIATTSTLRDIEGQVTAADQQTSRPLISRMPSPANTPSLCSPVAQCTSVDTLALPLESQAARLIDLFFSETGLLFPYVQQSYVTSTYNQARARNFNGVRRSFLCLLNAIFAMAAHLDADPRTVSLDAETFYQRGNLLLNQIDMKVQNVETVQSLLLMIQYRQGTQKSDDTWVLLGKAVRIALQLGLHSRSTSIGLNSVEQEVRTRVWLNCVMLDRVLSMTFGRPQTISKEYVRLDLPLNIGLDSLAESVCGSSMIGQTNQDTVCFFTATIQLYDVLSFILATIYDHNLNLESQTPLPEVLKHSITAEQKLLQWQKDLPLDLKRRPWDHDNISPGVANSVFDKLSAIIHLRYLNINLLHHRAIIDRFLTLLNYPANRASTSDTQDPLFIDFARHSLEVSQDSSIEMIDVIWRMSHRPGALGAWWFSAYYSFNACLMMYGCILVLFGTSRQERYGHKMAHITERQQKMFKLIASLNTGAGVIERVGKGTRTAKGIRRTLVKIIQISTKLAQILGPNEPLGITVNGFADANTTQSSSLQPYQASQQEPEPVDCGQPQYGSLSSEVQWDIPDLQYWTAQSDFDIFADLNGLDAGLGNFMAA